MTGSEPNSTAHPILSYFHFCRIFSRLWAAISFSSAKQSKARMWVSTCHFVGGVTPKPSPGRIPEPPPAGAGCSCRTLWGDLMPAGDSRRQIVGAAAPPGAMTVRSTAYCSGSARIQGGSAAAASLGVLAQGEPAAAGGGTAPEPRRRRPPRRGETETYRR